MAAKGDKRDDPSADDADDEARAAPKKESSPMKLVIVGAIALFVAVLAAQVAAPIVTKIIAGDSKAAARSAQSDDEQLALADSAADPNAENGSAEPTGPALYQPLDPPFVVSIESDGETRFVQLTLQAMARDQHTIDAIKTHSPAIRNAFLFVINSHKIEELSKLEGKEKLRAEMLQAANDIIEKNTGKPSIEDLYFTSFVIQ